MLPARARALLAHRGLCPLALLSLLEERLALEPRQVTVDRTFEGAQDGIHALVLMWNRVLRPSLVPRVRRVSQPLAFGGEGAAMSFLGLDVEIYFAREGGIPRVRLGSRDVALPPNRRLALVLVAQAVGGAATARDRCPCDRR